MWPFTSSPDKGKETAELAKELPPNLQEFFIEKNPDAKHAGVFDISPHQQRVNEVLLRQEQQNKEQPYSYKFQKYKSSENPRRVAGINCAEIQSQVLQCFQNWSFTDTNHCSAEIKNSMGCLEIQRDALKRLYYDDCYNETQCSQIRRAIDQLFTTNFGQLGDKVSDETMTKFDNDLDDVFFKIWK